MSLTLYSCKIEIGHDDISRHRITKFVDGEVESSYRTTHTECECPAGARPSCRHRQMLPQIIAAGIVNTEWFWDFGLGRPTNFDGVLKSNIEAMNELAAKDEGLCDDKGCPHADTDHVSIPSTKPSSWRRM